MKKIEILDADFNKIKKSADNAGDAVGDLNNTVNNLGNAVNEADKSLKHFDNSVDKMSDSVENMNQSGMDAVETFEHVTRVANAFVGAAEIVEGSLHLMGVESEAAEEAVRDMMALFAISDGFKSIAEGVQSFKQLKDAILVTQSATSAMNTAVEAQTTASTLSTAAEIANTSARAGNTKQNVANTQSLNAVTAARTAETTAIETNTNMLVKQKAIQIEIIRIKKLMYEVENKSNLSYIEKDRTLGKLNRRLETLRNRRAELLQQQEALAASSSHLAASTEQAAMAHGKAAATTAAETTATTADTGAKAVNTKANVANATSLSLIKKAQIALIAGFRKLKAFMISNPYTAVALAIGTVVAALYTWNSATDETEKHQEALARANKNVKDSIDDLAESYEVEARFMKARGESERDILEYKRAQAKIALATADEQSDKVQRDKNASKENKDEALANAQDAWKKLNAINIAITEYELNTRRKAEEDALAASKKAAEDARKLREQEARDRQTQLDNQIKDAADYDKEMMRLRKDVYDKYTEDIEKYNNKVLELNGKSRDIERNELLKTYNENIETAKLNREKGLLLEDEYDNLLLIHKQTYLQDKKALEKKFADEDNAARQAEINEIAQTYQDMRDKTASLYDTRIADAQNRGDNVSAVSLDIEKLEEVTELYKQQISLFEQMGVDTSELADELQRVSTELDALSNEEILAKIDTLRTTISGVAESFSAINAIGHGLSDEWGSVFDSMLTGLDKISETVKTGGKGWRQYGQMAVAGLSVASNMMSALAAEQDQSNEKGFEKSKKFQIAAASMSMLSGIVDSVTSAFSPANSYLTIFGQAAAAATMSAMVLATGIMNIQKIKSMKFGGDATGEAAANPNVSAMNNLSNGMQYASLIEGASTEGSVKDTRVYVLESDITRAQSNVKVSESEATF